jgi:transposase-like protein
MVDPSSQFCHNPDCPARGKVGEGNISVHSQKDRRLKCDACGKTFAATKGTPFYRLHKAADLMVIALTLLCHGCPVQAIVAAFGLDERTVADWQAKGGQHCQKVHEHIVQQGKVDLGHVQADEIWVKMVAKRAWMAMAVAVPSRLWLGGVISAHRDGKLITSLVEMVRSCASNLGILVCVDGLSSYVTAFLRVFRNPIRTGKVGRPRLVLEKTLMLGRVVKQYVKRRVVSVKQKVVRGTPEAIGAVLAATGGGKAINTAYIERLNATFRAALVVLVRRGRALAHKETVLTAGMFLVGCAYNFVWLHESLRLPAPEGSNSKWLQRTPAMAAGLTDHPWTMTELLSYQIPLPAWVAPKRRGRPPKHPPQPAWVPKRRSRPPGQPIPAVAA